MRDEAFDVPGRIVGLEDLRCDHVACGPADESHGHGDAFLGLACDVSCDKRDDHVAFGKEELGAVEGDEHAACIRWSWLHADDDDCSDDSGNCPDLKGC